MVMKYQVFFISLFCFISSSAMEKRRTKSLENSAQVADALQHYAHYICQRFPNADQNALAINIQGVRQSPMTNKQRYKAIALIYSHRLELVAELRAQENQELVEYERSEKRREIN